MISNNLTTEGLHEDKMSLEEAEHSQERRIPARWYALLSPRMVSRVCTRMNGPWAVPCTGFPEILFIRRISLILLCAAGARELENFPRWYLRSRIDREPSFGTRRSYLRLDLTPRTEYYTLEALTIDIY